MVCLLTGPEFDRAVSDLLNYPPVKMYLLIARILSLLIACGYVAAAIITSGEINYDLMWLGVYLLFPLALIWFPEECGELTGYVGQGGMIDTETPPFLVSIFGWLFLFAPIVVAHYFRQ